MWPSVIFSLLNQSLKKVHFFSFLKQKKRHSKTSAFASWQRVFQHHTVWRCCIQTPRSRYSEERILLKHSGLGARHRATKHQEWSRFCLITKGLCAVFVPAAAVCSTMSFLPRLSPLCKFSPVVHLRCCWSSWGREKSMTPLRIHLFISEPWSILAASPPLL